MKKLFLFSIIALGFIACRKDTKNDPEPEPAPTVDCPTCTTPPSSYTVSGSGPFLKFKFKFDSTQARLNSFGAAAPIPTTNAGFSPLFNRMSAHYIELAKDDYTQVGQGAVLYKAPETTCGGSNAIVFCESIVVKEDSIFFAIPFSSIPPGNYKWLRVSLAYQNYDIPFRTMSTGTITQWGTVASFIGFNNYVNQYKIKNMTMVPTASVGGPGNHKQGYWGFEATAFSYTTDGQPPAGSTTVVNPNPNSLIPPGSCLVTGELYDMANSMNAPLQITGTETADKTIIVSLSTNKSFEWKEVDFDGYYQPDKGEFPVDMGIRGMVPKY